MGKTNRAQKAAVIAHLVEGARTGLLMLASRQVQSRLGIDGGSSGVSRGEAEPLRLQEVFPYWTQAYGMVAHPVARAFEDPDLLLRTLDDLLLHGEDEPDAPHVQWIVAVFKGREEPSEACREVLMRIQRHEYAERRVSIPKPAGTSSGPQVRRVLFTEGVRPEPGTTIFLMSEVRVALEIFTGERVQGALCELPGLFSVSTTESVHSDGRQPGPAPVLRA